MRENKERINGKIISRSYFHTYFVNLTPEFRKNFNENRASYEPTLSLDGELYAKVYKKEEKLIIMEIFTRKQIKNRKMNPDQLLKLKE